MTDEQINKIISPLLHKRFKSAGFRHVTVKTEEDFDGSSILRVTAHFKKSNVNSDELIDALHQIRSTLLLNGEERFVFLNASSPQDDVVEEDVR